MPVQTQKIYDEVFLPIKNYEKYYMVSNYGKIKSLPIYRIDSIGRKRFYGERISHGYLKEGYRMFLLYDSNSRKKVSVHRLVAQAFLPNPESKSEVNHIDGNKANNMLDNLEWCTHSDNIKHAYDNGLLVTAVSGENCHKAKLTAKDVIEIRTSYKIHSKPYKELAAQYNVTPGLIGHILKNRIWKCLL